MRPPDSFTFRRHLCSIPFRAAAATVTGLRFGSLQLSLYLFSFGSLSSSFSFKSLQQATADSLQPWLCRWTQPVNLHRIIHREGLQYLQSCVLMSFVNVGYLRVLDVCAWSGDSETLRTTLHDRLRTLRRLCGSSTSKRHSLVRCVAAMTPRTSCTRCIALNSSSLARQTYESTLARFGESYECEAYKRASY